MIALVAWAAVAHAQRPTRGDDDSAALIAEGRAALRRAAYDEAARALDQAIVLSPRRIEAYVLRSAVYAARKQYRDGVALMRRAQAVAPDDDEVLTALGSQLVLSGDAAAGIPLLEQVVARNPARYDAELLLGRHRHAAGQWSGAIAAFEAFLAHRPGDLSGEDAACRLALGDAYLRDHQASKALDEFQRAARLTRSGLPARLGVAWAMAAIDCRRARPLLGELAPVAADHPEVWLVDGRCALALGELDAAIERGRRYLARQRGPAAAAGHALIGEALAARDALREARRELEAARRLAPGERRWAVRLASVLRRGGEPAAGRKLLEEIGAPTRPSDDPDWWFELGSALFAAGELGDAIARLGPVVAEVPDRGDLRGLLGEIELAAGDAEAAVGLLEAAEASASTPRARSQLAAALATVGARKLAAGDAVAAAGALTRAASLDDSPAIQRDLGIAWLTLDQPVPAARALDRAVQGDRAPVTMMLAARARALSGDLAGGRALYQRALAAPSPDRVEIAIDWAASELASGDPATAVTALERVAAAVTSGGQAGRHAAALAQARHAAGVAALRTGNPGRALELLGAAASAAPSLAVRCDLALAAVAAGDAATALAALGVVGGQRCPFPPPADVQAAPILRALASGLSPRRAGAALDRLTALSGKATGPAAALLAAAIRIVALEAASDAYAADHLADARRFVAIAQARATPVGGDELAHDAALIDLADGKLDAAIQALERLAPRLPDALIAVGVAHERNGQPRQALDAWRRARKAGVRFAPLAEWITAKQRIYGEPP